MTGANKISDRLRQEQRERLVDPGTFGVPPRSQRLATLQPKGG